MHRTSHWLGMDVHDVGTYRAKGEWRPLTPGMVLTIEPGLYVAEDDEKAPVEFRGIGVRIEDDVLVTGGAPEVLTAECVKEIHDIEAMVGSGPRYVSRVVLPGARLD
jgi:Xaa-Pro aminopeptidase